MMRVAVLLIALLTVTSADAGCFLFFCAHRHRHVQRHHHSHHLRPRIIVQHKAVVKTLTIVRERKAHAPAVDQEPITPLK